MAKAAKGQKVRHSLRIDYFIGRIMSGIVIELF